MTKSVRCLLALVGVLVFVAGVLVGQQAQRSKFEKYLKPVPVTEMRLSLLEANLKLFQSLTYQPTGIGIPIIEYNATCPCFEARTFVTEQFMGQPRETVRRQLLLTAITTRAAVEASFRELPGPDNLGDPDPAFKMSFWQEKGSSPAVVAECVNLDIIFK